MAGWLWELGLCRPTVGPSLSLLARACYDAYHPFVRKFTNQRAALAGITPNLSSCQAQVFPQEVDQQHSMVHFGFPDLAVNGYLNSQGSTPFLVESLFDLSMRKS